MDRTNFLSSLLTALVMAATPCGALELSGQVYARYVNLGDVSWGPSSEFLIRRASLTAKAGVGSNIEAELEIEARTDEVYLKDCLVSWSPSEALELVVGNFKKPFCLATTMSNWNLLSVERTLLHHTASDLGYSGRSMGAMAEFSPPMPLSPGLSLGVFNGPGEDRERSYAATAVVEPFPGLELGGGVSLLRLGEHDPMQPSGYVSSGLLSAFSGHFRFEHAFSGGTSLEVQGEYARGDNWEEADVVYGEIPPAFKSLWISGIARRRLRGVPGIRSLEGGLSWSGVEPGSDSDPGSEVLAPMLGVEITSSARLRFTLVNSSLKGSGGDDHTDVIAELAVRF